MGDLRLHIKDLKQALANIEGGREKVATKILEAILKEVQEPCQWISPAKPPADMGAWHWIWMAHSGLTGRTEVELVSPAIALRTALDLLEGS
jgi:hypothetical protein